MAKNTFSLIGTIGDYDISHQMVKEMMRQMDPGPVTVKVTSLGGSLSVALGIKELFETHGDVTLEYVGMNASASTVLGLGSKTKIREDSFFLIHKPLLWIDIFDRMNEDDIQKTIEDLKAKQDDANVFTLTTAEMYVKQTGKDIQTILQMMKEGKWMTAKQAVENKLVDELIPMKEKVKMQITPEMAAIMQVNGIPELPSMDMTENDPEQIINSLDEEKKKTVFQMLGKLFNKSNNNNNLKMNKEFILLMACLSVQELEEKEGKITLTVEQIKSIEAQMKALSDELATAKTDKTSAETAKTTAENSLTTVLNELSELDPKVKAAADATAKVTAVKAVLAARPAVTPQNPQNNHDSENVEDTVNWEDIDNLPHNKELDKDYTPQKQKK